MSMLTIWSIGFLVILIYMTVLWLISLRLEDASIVDIFWGPGFVILAFVYNVLSEDGFAVRKTLLTGLVTIWGVRLALHIFWRNRGHGEDPRYRKWRQQAGTRWWWLSYCQVFVLQGILMVIIATPLLVAQHSATPDRLTVLDGIGVLLWGIGFFFEAVGDWQLARFKANPANKGQVLDTGLWRYTRHPNYFGDACLWWGYYALALSAGGFWSIFSPVLMTGLLMKVSGVAMLERTLVESKPQYREYIARTSAFFPLPPRKNT